MSNPDNPSGEWMGATNTPEPRRSNPLAAFLQRAWRAFRSWPGWAQAVVAFVTGFFILGLIGSAVGVDDDPAAAPTTQDRPSSPSTTTSTSTTTTTATTATTTTLPPPLPPPPPPPPAVVEPLPAAACDSNYTGCVPIASDVDCEGGSGDGPEYTGPVEVIGADVYDLDADGDGLACE